MARLSSALVAVGALVLVACSGRSSVQAFPSGASGSGGAGGTSSAGAGGSPETYLPDDFVVPGWQPHLDVGDDGHAVFAFTSEQALRAVLYRTRAEGARWGQPVELLPSVFELSPSQGGYSEAALELQGVRAAATGESWVVYSRVEGTLFEAGSETGLYLQHHSGMGADRDWAPPELIATMPFRTVTDPSSPDVHLALSGSGRVAVAWSAWGGAISVRIREPSGTWSDTEEVPLSATAGAIASVAVDDDGYVGVAYPSPEDETLVSSRAPGGSWSALSVPAAGSYAQATATASGKLWVSERKEESLAVAFVHPGRSASFGTRLALPEGFAAPPGPTVRAVVGDDQSAHVLFAAGPNIALDGPPPGGLALVTYAFAWLDPIVLVPPDGSASGVAADVNTLGDAAVWFESGGAALLFRTRDGILEPIDGLTGFPGPIALAPDGRVLVVAHDVTDEDVLDVRWLP